jgi:hypothetical protein
MAPLLGSSPRRYVLPDIFAFLVGGKLLITADLLWIASGVLPIELTEPCGEVREANA